MREEQTTAIFGGLHIIGSLGAIWATWLAPFSRWVAMGLIILHVTMIGVWFAIFAHLKGES